MHRKPRNRKKECFIDAGNLMAAKVLIHFVHLDRGSASRADIISAEDEVQRHRHIVSENRKVMCSSVTRKATEAENADMTDGA